MKLHYYHYNAFIIESDEYRIAIDPGRNLWWLNMNSLIPEDKWPGISHLLVTHSDPDHFDYAIPLAQASNAAVICHQELTADFKDAGIEKIHSLGVGESRQVHDLQVQGLRTEHGPLKVRLGGGLVQMDMVLREAQHAERSVHFLGIRLRRWEQDGPVRNHGTIKLLWGLLRFEKDNVDEFARGVIGYRISVGDKTFVNLGDTIYLDGWEDLRPDVLMIPIGGIAGNTMDNPAALKAIQVIQPDLVIPCHYNCAFLWRRIANPNDDRAFKAAVEQLGIRCEIMNPGGALEI